jgi:hypothetical protein
MTRQAFFAARLEGVFDPVNNYIMYLGGDKRSNSVLNYTINPINRPFDQPLLFFTENSTWVGAALTGDIPAAGRTNFSLTLCMFGTLFFDKLLILVLQYLVQIDTFSCTEAKWVE